eukprot:GAFH01000720.1.p1 GENE.GAFH01000720.1~~GAFH01000720.1.p1  ORF type:complete len:921 (-),score=371.88 GAFH01000720.1:1123-3885(-)
MLEDSERLTFLHKLHNPRLESIPKKNLGKKIIDKCKKCSFCPHCSAFNGSVKKVGPLKLVHEKYKGKDDWLRKEFQAEFSLAIQQNKEIAVHLPKAQEDLSPLHVSHLFRRISDEDCELLGFDPARSRPERMILDHVLVPPCAIRPSVCQDASSGSNEDDLTMKLTEIIHTNNVLKAAIAKGQPMNTIMEDWDFLQVQCAMFINSEVPGLNQRQANVKSIRGICQRLKGKQGRFRGNLSGKRVDFSGRTVISPDPNLQIDEVAVPRLIAMNMTYPERVHPANIERLRKLVINGPTVHPGANFIELRDGSKRFLKYGDRQKMAEQLRVGDIVERHLEDGDIVLFNRQPSLHKMSIMCHRAKIMPWRTLRFNVCDCTPYNADFDGDEMNLHLPQTEEARAEAAVLMAVHQNLCTPRHGAPLIAPTQDFLTGGYLMSRRDCFMDKAMFCMCVAYAFDGDSTPIDLPEPAIIKPVALWTGKQLFRVMVKPNAATEVYVNLELKEKNYSESGTFMDPNDGYVYFHNSELVAGNLCKGTLGSGGKSSLFYFLQCNYGPIYSAKCMSRLAKMTSRWLMNRGFSIGISDVAPSASLTAKKEELVRAGYEKVSQTIADYRAGRLEASSGCTQEETMEAIINGLLSRIRDQAGNMCLQELDQSNPPLIMAICGSKGSNINISQMVACVGQQIISGKRIPNGFLERSLPHFPRNSRSPPAKGFVRNSFYTGLTATEFFMHTMAGREGLVDTAVKTAETGYMQRRLMKALEDLTTNYDGTVRTSTGGVVEFRYGEDGLDPVDMEAGEKPINMPAFMKHLQAVHPTPRRTRSRRTTSSASPTRFSPRNSTSPCTITIRWPTSPLTTSSSPTCTTSARSSPTSAPSSSTPSPRPSRPTRSRRKPSPTCSGQPDASPKASCGCSSSNALTSTSGP